MPRVLTLTVEGELTESRREQVDRLIAAARTKDGFAALNDAATLQLHRPDSAAQHLLAVESGQVVGYAQLDPGPVISTGFLVVDPAHRRRGIGVRLAQALADQATTPLQLWAPGDTVAAQALAARIGLVPARTLLVMTRRLDKPLPEPKLPTGIAVRTFQPGRDEQAWLALNAEAFANHPEQGLMTEADLAARMAEPWFDPKGFFVAMRGEAPGTEDHKDQMVGFHWTKRHGNHLGEVYVLAVSPVIGGLGLGKALLLIGLEHLRKQGDTAVKLYVEADNPDAVGLYRDYGFTTSSRDVMYARRPTRARQES
jgi:mycothiol synthase